jgi:hypothetical protein
MGTCIQRITHDNRLHLCFDLGDERLEDRAMDQSTRPGNTALARCTEITRDEPVGRAFQVCVIKNQDGRFATR